MQFEQVVSELKKFRDPRVISAWKKMNMNTDNYWGVGLTKIQNIAKKIRKSHPLAVQLRNSGIRDAIHLSFMIDEPKKLSRQEIKSIMKMIDYRDLSDSFCSYVLINSPFVLEQVDEWKDSSKEMTKRSAYMMVNKLAECNRKLEDGYFEEFLERIEKEIEFSKNWVREAMLYSITSIGKRNENLRNKAIAVANKIGKVKVEYKNRECVAPDPLAVLVREKIYSKHK